MLTQFVLCCEREIFFLLYMNCCWLVYWLCFLCFLCICVLVLYLLVVRAASIDGCLCLSGSLPLLSVCLCLLCFETNKYDDDDLTYFREKVDRVLHFLRLSSVVVRRTKCTRQLPSCWQLWQLFTNYNFFITGRLSN